MYPSSIVANGALACLIGACYASAVEPDECLVSTQHHPVTVTEIDGIYTQCYTSTYTQLGAKGLHEKTYTIFETCSQPVCRFPLETALPPGFTTGAVYCETCNSGGPLETTLTFPSASLGVYNVSTVPGGTSHNATGHSTTSPTPSYPLIVEAAGRISKPSAAAGVAVSLFYLVAWAL